MVVVFLKRFGRVVGRYYLIIKTGLNISKIMRAILGILNIMTWIMNKLVVLKKLVDYLLSGVERMVLLLLIKSVMLVIRYKKWYILSKTICFLVSIMTISIARIKK